MADDFEDLDILSPSTQATIDQVLAEANGEDVGPKPVIADPPSDTATLPSGVKATVCELTGEHEERLSKAHNSDDPTRWYNILLECGTETLNGEPADRDALNNLLVGDREALLLAIRAATYGSEVEIRGYCPECREAFEGTVDITKQIPVREYDGESRFAVNLRKGGVARVRLPIGSDQTAYMQDPDLTDSERNSVLLSRVVSTLTSNGQELPVAGFPSLVRDLGVADRKRILDEIDKRMPGPRYDEVEIEHECGNKLRVPPIGVVALFPGL